MNAFTSARPRGIDAPSKPPQNRPRSKAPLDGSLRGLHTQSARTTIEAQAKQAQTMADQALYDSRRERLKRTACATPAERAKK